MWHGFFAGFQFIHGILLVIGAIGLFKFWRRSGFWLPTYIHVMAAIGFVVTYWALSSAPADAPAGKDGPFGRLLIALILPAIIYFYFLIHGGQRAAFDRSFAPCPSCQKPIRKVDRVVEEAADEIKIESHFVESVCPHCGTALT